MLDGEYRKSWSSNWARKEGVGPRYPICATRYLGLPIYILQDQSTGGGGLDQRARGGLDAKGRV